jgi:hypothetical protein
MTKKDEHITEPEKEMEGIEPEKDLSEEKKEKTTQELFEALAEDFSEYLNKNIDSLKGKSLTQIFMDFISQAEKEKKDLLNLIKQKL